MMGLITTEKDELISNDHSEKKLSVQTLLFSCLKLVSCSVRCAVKIVPKEIKEKHICLGIYNIQV